MTKILFKFMPILILILIFGCNKNQNQLSNKQSTKQTNWPIFRGNTNFSGVAHGTLPDSLQRLWTFKAEDEIKSSPVVENGKIYFGSMDGKLYCIDLESGKKLWEFTTETSFEAPPLILNNTIFIGNVNRIFYAIHADSGTVKWQSETGGKIMGSANWMKKPNSDTTFVYVGCYDSRMYCFNSETGEKVWTYNTKNFINGAPAIYKEFLIFGGCDAYLHQVSGLTGKRKIRVDMDSYVAASPAVYKNFAYAGNYDCELVSVNLIDTSKVWTYYDEEEGGPFFSSPAVNEKYVLIGSRDFRLHCIHRETGERNWVFRTQDDVESSPVILGEKVIFSSADGRVFIVNIDDGTELWSYEVGCSIISSPAIASGKIIIGADDGSLYCFGQKEER